jgi:DNA-binding HxlR family transcriptional regulator
VTRRKPGIRSHCPVSYALDLFGDPWTLLVIRDIALFGKRTYQEFLGSAEGVATNVLADRLERLEAARIVTKRPDPDDRRRTLYLLTERGIDLVPVLFAMIEWSARHDGHTLATPEKLAQIRAGRPALEARLRAELKRATMD